MATALPAATMLQLSEKTVVQDYIIGFSKGGSGPVVLWKLRYQSGETDLFFVPAAIAIHFTKATRRAARKLKWPASPGWPDDAPVISDAEWDFLNSKYPVVSGLQTQAFSDAALLAFKVGPDVWKVARLAPAHAVQIATLHWDELRNGNLLDIEAEPTRTDSRH